MLPIRLELTNFLPYRAPDPIRFEGIHLACLTGRNGAGKSSLLDAITWALWGRARARRDDDLVHMGQGEMAVQLEFDQEGQRYTVIRRRKAGKRGQATLNLFVFDPQTNSDTQITEPSIRATQNKINAILRLDYETFVHSAFLQQGKADAFTTRTASERKKILSDILGLERWAAYEDKVKEKLKGITNKLTYCERRIEEIDRELTQRPAFEADHRAAQASLEAAQTARDHAEQQLAEVADAPHDLRHAREERKRLEGRLHEIDREMQTLAETIEATETKIDSYRDVIDAAAEIEAGYAALTDARQQDTALNETLRRLQPLDKERAELQAQVERARVKLETRRDELARQGEDLQRELETDYSKDLQDVQGDVTDLQATEQQRDDLDAQITTWKEQRAGEKARLDALAADGKAKRDQLERLEADDVTGAHCPLCGQPLDADHRDQLTAEIDAQVLTMRADYKTVQESIQTLDDRIKTEQETLKAMDTELRRLPALRERLGTLRQQVNERESLQERLESVKAEHETTVITLNTGDYAVEAQAQLAEIEAERDTLGYDEQIATDVQATIAAYSQYDEQNTRLAIARESLPSYESQLADASKRQTSLTEARAERVAEQEAVEAEIKRLLVQVEEYQKREQAVKTQRTVEVNARERVTIAEQKLSTLDNQAQYKADLSAERDTLREQEAHYTELRRAFGKNGVPAMVIETAIPELEQTANDLLARMTDGRMHLRLNTQKEKVTGGQMETLEIAIADELGERSYELYSGGEAFRINFAIRVALSKMLARRAGAHLRTLFIDEGFGTQDDDGRSKLVEAITAIQDEFDLLLVITHIDELRDNFPVHIDIEKTADGSRVQVR
jgi:DNA repair protein SbcC/Rad50